jgi:hypothetical protein
MRAIPGLRRITARLARILGFDGNPLRRASDRAEAWIRVSLLAAFLIAGPLAALGAGHWAYHAGIAAVQAAQTQHVTAAAPQPTLPPIRLARPNGGSHASARVRREASDASARTGEVLAAVMMLALMALAFLAVLRLTLAFLSRRRLAAWETAWSRVGPQWTGGRS